MQGNEHIPSSLEELREKHLEVFGEETRSYHKEFLRKRIAWRLQAVAEGDLSERARRRAEELANDADLRTRAPRDPATSGSAEVKVRMATGRIPPSRDPRLPLPGWTLLYARDTTTGVASLLGFIPADADPRELLGVPLPDGVYEIEFRPSELFWDECRGRKVITLIAGSAGGGGSTTGLPVIQNLRREIVSFQSVIRWSVVAEYEPGAFEFGLWFGLALPVDTSGAPDHVVPYVSSKGEYRAAHSQTAPEYVAVRAFNPTDQGLVSELFLDWDTVAPVSPPDQYAIP